jgi:predicted O-methyltransferase YrrM
MSNNYYSKYNPKIIFFKILNKLLMPFKAANVQISAIASANDDNSTTTKFLFDTALESSKIAFQIDLNDLEKREKEGFKYIQIYPGEHYKLLAGFMLVLRPKIVIEIGTYLGQAALTIKKYLPPDGRIYTFDIIKWQNFEATCLTNEDFDDGKLVQYNDDLTQLDNINKHKEIIENADFIFIDALKDGAQEIKFLNHFEKLNLKSDCILMFDDIRVWNMLKIWRDIKRPKLDITSFGHWSGTGLVHWNG